jgi:hypothetical protein
MLLEQIAPPRGRPYTIHAGPPLIELPDSLLPYRAKEILWLTNTHLVF